MEVIFLTIFIVILTLANIFLAKLFYIHTVKGLGLKSFHIDFATAREFLLPFGLLAKLNMFNKANRHIFKRLIVCFTFVAVATTIFSLSIVNFLSELSDASSFEILLNISFFVILFYFFLYLSVFDIVSFSIPEIILKWGLILMVGINLLIGITRYLYSLFDVEDILTAINLGKLDNLVGGILFAGIIWIVIKITKNEGMGDGDIDIFALIGLSLGLIAGTSAFFFTVLIGGLVAILYTLVKGKYKGVMIPFVPLATLGFVLAIGFSDEFISFITNGAI